MSVVYKYCDGYGVEILRNLEVKITPPNQFNDPFEFTPHITCSNLIRTAKRMVKEKDAIREIYQNEKRTGTFAGNFRQYRQRHKANQPALIQLAIKRIPSDLVKLQQSLLDVVSAHFGVLCISKRRDSLLMWGHYCNKHPGIVIGFDSSHPMFKQTPGLHPVNYVRARVRIDESAHDMNAEWLQRREMNLFSRKMMSGVMKMNFDNYFCFLR